MWRQRDKDRGGRRGEEERWQDEEKRENRDENTRRKAGGRQRVTGRRDPRTGNREEGDKAVRKKCGNRQRLSVLVLVRGEDQRQQRPPADHSRLRKRNHLQ